MRKIWGHPSCILLIFAGSSAEFALNPEAEWLFYTGKLPADPIERFLGTLRYSKELVFAPTDDDYRRTVKDIRSIHTHLERSRGRAIPESAYFDVLFMNIEYSIRSFPLVFGSELSPKGKDAVVASFRRMAELMAIPNAPADYASYARARQKRFKALGTSVWTERLLDSYRRALGRLAFFFLMAVYGALLEPAVRDKLGVKKGPLSRFFSRVYPLLCRCGGDKLAFVLFLPRRLTRALREVRLPGDRGAGLGHEL